jgi:hypothetical protein
MNLYPAFAELSDGGSILMPLRRLVPAQPGRDPAAPLRLRATVLFYPPYGWSRQDSPPYARRRYLLSRSRLIGKAYQSSANSSATSTAVIVVVVEP